MLLQSKRSNANFYATVEAAVFFGIVRVLGLEFAETRCKYTVGREPFLDKHLYHVHGTFGRKVPVRV